MEINKRKVLFKTGGVLGRGKSREVRKRRKERGIAEKGATLIELVVVFAVLAIISTVVISFVMMSNENVKASRDKVDALNDISVVESIVESWVENRIKDKCSFLMGTEKTETLVSTVKEDITYTYELIMEGNDLKEKVTSNDDTTSTVLYTSVAIKSIKFYCEESKVEEGNEIIKRDTIVYCYITYGKNDYVYTFTVYPYNFIGTEEVQ